MKYIISDGSEQEINIGDHVKTIIGRLDAIYDDTFLEVVDQEVAYPHIKLGETISALSPELITEVKK